MLIAVDALEVIPSLQGNRQLIVSYKCINIRRTRMSVLSGHMLKWIRK
jgi:hypothetical protein